MATYDKRVGTATGGHPARDGRAVPYKVDVVLDFAAITNVANDVFKALTVRKGAVVLAAGVEVLVADTAGNSGTLALGDGSVTYVAAAAPTSAAYMTAANVGPTQYGAEESLDLTVGTGAVNCKVRVYAVICDVSA